MRYLLDKNIVRFALVALRYGSKRELSVLEQGSLEFIQQVYESDGRLFISDTSHNILQKWRIYREVQILHSLTDVLIPTRYYKRWSRRIRETSGLASEDAAIIALGTFGCAEHETFLGVDIVITYDQPMINGFEQTKRKLNTRLASMSKQLDPPFDQTTLPDVVKAGDYFT